MKYSLEGTPLPVVICEVEGHSKPINPTFRLPPQRTSGGALDPAVILTS